VKAPFVWRAVGMPRRLVSFATLHLM
jgi:hypothetical protein